MAPGVIYAPLVSLQLSGARHICQTDSSKPKTLTMFLSKVKLHLFISLGEKAIPLIILFMKVTNELETWQPLASIRKTCRTLEGCFWVQWQGPLMKSFQRHKETLIKHSGAQGDGGAMLTSQYDRYPTCWRVCCFTATYHRVGTWLGFLPHVVGLELANVQRRKRCISRWDKVIVVQDTK